MKETPIMTQTITCPDAGVLKELLDGNLPQERQAELNSHLEGCMTCQQKLEGLAAGKETWTGVARNLSAAADAPQAGLERVMAQSKKEGQSDTSVETRAAEVPLDFLSPPEDAAHLGRLDDYEVLEIVGRGGMSVVLKAVDPVLQRVIALKVMAPQLAAPASARLRFLREGRAAAAVNHEHVVAIYAVGESNGLPYIVMEYISGLSLQERLDQSGPLELKEILRIGTQTAQGLAAAHAQGLVHRDIKPANILLHNGVARVKITDFGLARAVDDASLTQSGFVAGTPQYMSPEQARGDAIDHRTDLFSLGSVLYAMCTGRPPFRASTTMGVLKRVSEESARAVREVNPEIPPWLAEIIARLHARNPAERFQSAAEVAEVLGRHLAQLQQGASMPTAAMPAPVPSAPARSGLLRERRWAIAAALLPLLAGAFVVSETTGVTGVTEFVATVLRIRTPSGTLVIETDDPAIEVIVDGDDIKIHGAGPKEIHVKAGEHRIRAITKDGKEFDQLVTVMRGSKQIVRIRHENPKDAVVGRPVPPVHGLPGFVHMSTLQGHTGHIYSVAFAPDGKTLVSTAGGSVGAFPKNATGEIKLWDLLTYKVLWSVKDPSGIKTVAFSPGSTTLATGDIDGTVRLRNVDRGDLIKILPDASGRSDVSAPAPVNAVAFAPDGQMVAAGNAAGVVKIVRVGTREMLEKFKRGSPQITLCLAYSPDGKTLAVGGMDDKANISPVTLFEVGSWKARVALTGHQGAVTSLVFSPDGKLLATAGEDKTIKLWSAADGKDVATLKGHTARVSAVAFSRDGTLLFSAGLDKTVKVWDVVRRKLFLSSPQDTVIHSLALSPDGKTLAVGGTLDISLWNIASVYAQSALRQRLATLRQRVARIELQYKEGYVAIGTFQHARLAMLDGELELCETPRERIAVLKQIVGARRVIENIVETAHKAGAASEDSLLEARAKRQEAEINLQREAAKVPGTVVPGPAVSEPAGGASKQTYRLQLKDVVRVAFPASPWNLAKADLDDLLSAGGGIPTPLFPVSADGALDLGPTYGRVKVAGKTVAEVTEIVTKRIKNFTKAELVDTGKVAIALWQQKGGRAGPLVPNKQTYQLRPQDILKIQFPAVPKNLRNDDVEDLQRAGYSIPSPLFVVGPEGTLDLGHTYGRVKVVDKTVEEVAEIVTKRVKEYVSPKIVKAGNIVVERSVVNYFSGQALRSGAVAPGPLGSADSGPAAKTAPDKVRGIAILGVHEDIVWSLKFAPDGKSLVGAGGGAGKPTTAPVSGEITRWDVAPFLDPARQPSPAQGKAVWSAKSPSIIFAAAYSPGGMTLATAEADGTVRLREADRGWVLGILRGHKGPVYGPVYTVAFAPDGQTLASAGLDRIVRIWHVGTKELLESFDSGNTKLAKCLAFSKDGKTLAVGGQDMHLPGGPAVAEPDGNVAKKRHPHTVRLFEVGSWKARAVLSGHDGPVEYLAFSPDGKLLATAGDDQTVRLWNPTDGKEVATLKSPVRVGKIRCLAFSPDSTILATCGDNQTTNLWDVRRRQVLEALGGERKVFALAFSPDGKMLAHSGSDRTIELWDVAAAYRTSKR
jgi:WD40 repeat protein